MILGDVALQRGETSLAARAYFEAARETRDPRLARRGAEIALAARMRGLAQESAKLWATLDPTAEQPKQMLAASRPPARGQRRGVDGPVDSGGQGAGSRRPCRRGADRARAGRDLPAAQPLLRATHIDKRQVYELVRELAKPYPNSAEAHFAVALAAYNGGAPEGTGGRSGAEGGRRALAIKPDWERAALLEGGDPVAQEARRRHRLPARFVAANPDARAPPARSRSSTSSSGVYAEARAVFQKLWDSDRSAREFEFGVAVISMQMKDWDTAEALLLDLKRANYGDNGAVELYLAQIAEETRQLSRRPSSATRRCRKASARGSRSSASRR